LAARPFQATARRTPFVALGTNSCLTANLRL
jgi:hypothetical protein